MTFCSFLVDLTSVDACRNEGGIDRRIDKVCILIQLLKKKFGQELERVPLGLLLFTVGVDFRYDVRSLAHLVDLIPYRKNIKEITMENLSLPLKTAALLKRNSLAYHLLHEDQGHGVVKKWQEANVRKTLVNLDIKIARIMETFPRQWRKTYIHRWLDQQSKN